MNYYEVLGINTNATTNEIKSGYKTQINKFTDLPFLTDKMIQEVKLYKTAYYVLKDKKRRNKYDFKMNNSMVNNNNNNYDSYDKQLNNTINDRIFGNIFK